MKVVSIVNQKGGCGKTTTAVNLAYALANKGHKILIVDLDPQAHATFSLDISPDFTTTDLLESIINRESLNIDTYLIERADNLFVLGSSIGLSVIEQTLSNREDKIDVLTKLLEKCKSKFDYCIIDCPPNLGVLTLNALVASTYAIIPVGICELSLKGVENLNNILTMLTNYRKSSLTLFYLVTQLDKRFNFTQRFLKKMNDTFKDKMFSVKIRTNIHLREAAACGMSIFEYKKDARGAQDYQELADEFEKATKNAKIVKCCYKGKDVKNVYLIGEFNDWEKNEKFKLKKVNNDTWVIDLFLAKGKYRYKFIADNKWIRDPSNVLVEDDSFGGKNSILFVK